MCFFGGGSPPDPKLPDKPLQDTKPADLDVAGRSYKDRGAGRRKLRIPRKDTAGIQPGGLGSPATGGNGSGVAASSGGGSSGSFGIGR